MKCKIIAELSCNHGGDISLAKKMIVAAHDSGVDYVKFQTWRVENLSHGPWDHDGRREIYERSELTESHHLELSDFCRSVGVGFLTSCFCKDDLDMIRKYTSIIKIPSSESKNEKLVLQASKKFDQVFVSIGATNFSEYEAYLNHDNIFVLHCVSIYPCPLELINLPRLKFLSTKTERYGYSGHAEGINDAISAIALGSKVVEKHFTIDNSLPFRDNKYAILPDQMRSIVTLSEDYNKMSIDKGLNFQPEELEVREVYANRWSK